MFSRDVLQLICERIKDPYTFEQFSLVNKHCAGIVKGLRPDKTKQFLWNLKQDQNIFIVVESMTTRIDSRIYLITGKQGSGKTTLLNYLVNKTKQTHECVRVSDHILGSQKIGDILYTYRKWTNPTIKYKKPVCMYINSDEDVLNFINYTSFMSQRKYMLSFLKSLPDGSIIIIAALCQQNSYIRGLIGFHEMDPFMHLHLTREP